MGHDPAWMRDTILSRSGRPAAQSSISPELSSKNKVKNMRRCVAHTFEVEGDGVLERGGVVLAAVEVLYGILALLDLVDSLEGHRQPPLEQPLAEGRRAVVHQLQQRPFRLHTNTQTCEPCAVVRVPLLRVRLVPCRPRCFRRSRGS